MALQDDLDDLTAAAAEIATEKIAEWQQGDDRARRHRPDHVAQAAWLTAKTARIAPRTTPIFNDSADLG